MSEPKDSGWKVWLGAARLRTLPLALSGTGMGQYLAFQQGNFDPVICGLTFLTTLFLQVLSNFANDLGDSLHGADHASRQGPARAVQSGKISTGQMKIAVVTMAIAALLSGIGLLYVCFRNQPEKALPLFLTGLLAIAAAYFYTNGKKPYGYMALGDVSVFLFFGFVAVSGSYYLHTLSLSPELILPSCAMGLWSTAVLNINNMRDRDSDFSAGKTTLPIVLGPKKALAYHTFLVLGGLFCFLYPLRQNPTITFLFLIPGLGLVLRSFVGVLKSREVVQMDQNLKPMALGIFIMVSGLWAILYFSKH